MVVLVAGRERDRRRAHGHAITCIRLDPRHTGRGIRTKVQCAGYATLSSGLTIAELPFEAIQKASPLSGRSIAWPFFLTENRG